jgi:hypothetical protein
MEIVMGRDPKQQRLTVLDDNLHHGSCVVNDDDCCYDDDGDFFGCWSSPECLAINMIDEACRIDEVESMHANVDSWTRAALTLSASIDEVSLMIQRKAALYSSSIDTLNICFDGLVPSMENSMTNADRSILETTVASFAAGMAKQIESLRKTVGHTDNADDYSSRHWASGRVGHRAGISDCLLQRLKVEIMDPMTKLQTQREKSLSRGKNSFSGDEALFIAQNPLRMFHSSAEVSVRRSLPPAPWEVGEHDAEKDREEQLQEKNEFINIYLSKGETSGDSTPDDIASKILPPPSVLRFMDLPRRTTSKAQQYQTQQKIHIIQPPTLNRAPPPPSYGEQEDHMDQLQRESATLLATYQNLDTVGVQKVERSMVEITSLLSRFTDLISEQQDSVFMIHDQAMKSKQNVDKGQDQLVDAANRGDKSKHPMATFIFLSALLLLLFNWVLP